MPSQTTEQATASRPTVPVNGATLPGLASLAGAVAPRGDGGDRPGPTAPAKPKGAGGFYLAALMGTGISVDTSFRFFRDVVGITAWWELVGMFAVLEVTLVACGYAMRANVRREPYRPGTPRLVAFVLCGLSAYMAVALSGVVVGVARVAAGPVLALVCLHLALGIEVRVRRGQSTGTVARVGRELRERALSRLGLADDERDAASRSRNRAIEQAAWLVADVHGRRKRQLAKALRKSGVMADATRREHLLEQVSSLRHMADLTDRRWVSPWVTAWDIESDIESDIVEDTATDTRTDTRTDMSEGACPDTETDIEGSPNRTSSRTPHGPDTRTQVTRLYRRNPHITAAEAASKVGCSEKTAQRHLGPLRAAAAKTTAPEGAQK